MMSNAIWRCCMLLQRAAGRIRAWHVLASTLLLLLVSRSQGAANDPIPQLDLSSVFNAPFSTQTDLRITMTSSTQNPGSKPVVCAIIEFGKAGHKAWIYSKVLRPDLLPKGSTDNINLSITYEDGMAREQKSKNQSWIKYKCTENDFLDYLNYSTALWLYTAIVPDIAKNPTKYVKSEDHDTVTFKPLQPIPDFPMASVTVFKTTPIRLAGITFGPMNGQPASLITEYDYDGKSTIGEIDKPPFSFLIKEVASPLKDRMVYP